jgi:hypothetical protein
MLELLLFPPHLLLLFQQSGNSLYWASNLTAAQRPDGITAVVQVGPSLH